jgi:hypothetical protein
MNSTLSDWSAKLRLSFDNLHPSVIPSFSKAHVQDILVTIGLITIFILIFISILRFIIKVRQRYKMIEPEERCKISYQHRERTSTYQNLLDTDRNQCKCFQYSCLPKLQCIKPSCQIKSRYPYYEQIDERKVNNAICRVYTASNTCCVSVHTMK